MINGLDLFSGIGGLAVALEEWVRPVAYCEIDPYCRGVLMSQMARGSICKAPIWDDVTTLRGFDFQESLVDILYGGFPCQDISVAGHGKGLAGERSGLFWQIVRLSKEIKPKFIFLENVPAITSRGGLTVVRAIAEMGYDCRWCIISAASVGALHKRERWFLLCQRNDDKGTVYPTTKDPIQKKSNSFRSLETSSGIISDTLCIGKRNGKSSEKGRSLSAKFEWASENVADTRCKFEGCSQVTTDRASFHDPRCGRFWEIEPDVVRVVDGLPQRLDRIRGLGNAVVPCQAKEAFKILMGMA